MSLFIVVIFGLVIGSFLNVVIHRLPKKESILGYSKCPRCRKMISWHENIPVLSFLFLRGRCRSCRSSISWQYPIVELLSGFLFLIAFLVYGPAPFLIHLLFLISLLIAVAFIDLNHFLILDSLILAGFVISALLIFNFPYLAEPMGYRQFLNCEIVSCSFEDAFFGASFFAGILLLLFLITKGKGIGLGDVKLAGWLGFVFGLENSISVFFLTFFIGFIWAIILLTSKRAGLKSRVPLGSLMALASILFLLSGFNLLDFINSEAIFRIW
ncbi:MAG: prepilin peptidase [Parcubacteria group bacterium]|nr:prepilin peptidase [Parcubacteria group bacterium]